LGFKQWLKDIETFEMKKGPSKKSNLITSALIAPCGMNCRLCYAYIREKNACPGCRDDDSLKPITRVRCKIKICDELTKGKVKYCSGCDSFPCKNLDRLDKRYRTKYSMSMIGNLKNIKQLGIQNFIRQEKERWACSKCGETVCVHKECCVFCGNKWR
jgi:hypothetical protein